MVWTDAAQPVSVHPIYSGEIRTMGNKSRIDRGHARATAVRLEAKTDLEEQVAANPDQNDAPDVHLGTLAADAQQLQIGTPEQGPAAPTGTAEAAATALEMPASVDLTAERGQTSTFLHVDEAATGDTGEGIKNLQSVLGQSSFVSAAIPGPAAFSAVDSPVSGLAFTPAPAPSPEPFFPVRPAMPPIPQTDSVMAKSLYATIETYIQAIPPRTPIEPATLVQQQVYLYRAITGIINKLEGEEFTQAWSWLLACFFEYRKDVFGERHVYRAMEEITLSPDDRKAFQRLLNLLILTCEPASRAIALRQIDMPKTLALGVTEPGRQRIHAYYGV